MMKTIRIEDSESATQRLFLEFNQNAHQIACRFRATTWESADVRSGLPPVRRTRPAAQPAAFRSPGHESDSRISV
ncbi:MAG: hypothetical protein ABJZ55_22275 [Fuerstiella sp.]